VAVLLVLSVAAASRAAEPFTFACRSDNDVYQILTRAGERHARFDTPGEAVNRAAMGSVLLVLADRYPAAPVAVDAKFYEAAKAKRLRLYVEYPAMAPGVTLSAPKHAVWERGIVATDQFGSKLPRLALFSAHSCSYLPASPARKVLLSIGRVAGFDSAVYGMPKDADPLLFAAGDDVLIATTKLSGFVTGRYAPADRWTAIWEQILKRLDPEASHDLSWTPTARPSYDKEERLPSDWEKRSFDAAATWVQPIGIARQRCAQAPHPRAPGAWRRNDRPAEDQRRERRRIARRPRRLRIPHSP
jgi:hypothetical protein